MCSRTNQVSFPVTTMAKRKHLFDRKNFPGYQTRNTPSKQTLLGRGATLKSNRETSTSLSCVGYRPSLHQLATQKTNNSDQSRREQDHATRLRNRGDSRVEVGCVEQEITVIVNTEGHDVAGV